jgi:hypothetical protein
MTNGAIASRIAVKKKRFSVEQVTSVLQPPPKVFTPLLCSFRLRPHCRSTPSGVLHSHDAIERPSYLS